MEYEIEMRRMEDQKQLKKGQNKVRIMFWSWCASGGSGSCDYNLPRYVSVC